MRDDKNDLEAKILDEQEFNDSLMKTMKYYNALVQKYQIKYNECVEMILEAEWYKANGYRVIYKKDKTGLYFEPEKREIGFHDEKER